MIRLSHLAGVAATRKPLLFAILAAVGLGGATPAQSNPFAGSWLGTFELSFETLHRSGTQSLSISPVGSLSGEGMWFGGGGFGLRGRISPTGVCNVAYQAHAENEDFGGQITGTATIDRKGDLTVKVEVNVTGNIWTGTWDLSPVSGLTMGTAFSADRHELSLARGGAQKLQLDAGRQHAGRSYAILGSVTGTSPGITLAGTPIPLAPDVYTDATIYSSTLPIFGGFRGKLDSNGEATASLNVPSGLPSSLVGLTLYHAYLVYDRDGIHMASNPVSLRLY